MPISLIPDDVESRAIAESRSKIEIKGGGQECPPYTGDLHGKPAQETSKARPVRHPI